MSHVGAAAPQEISAAPGATAARSWWRDSRHVLGLIILATWIPLVGLALWSFPRPATGAELQAAAQSGSVTAWRFVGTDTHDPAMGSTTWQLGANRRPAVAPSTAAYVVWQDREHRQYQTDIAAIPVPSAATDANRGAAVEKWLGDSFSRHNAGGWPGDLDEQPTWITWMGIVMVVAALMAIVGGEQPRVGTRWFWFWLLGATAGLGFAAYAVVEGLRGGERTRPRKPYSGWQGIALLVVGSFVVSGFFSLFG